VAPSATEPAAEPQTRKKNGPPHGFSKSMATVSLPPGTKPSGNIISFRVVHGLAIAYGDLILGTPEDTSLDSGFYEAPRPTLWDRGEVPYLISPDLPNPDRVMAAIRYFNEKTSVSFVPFDGQPDALVFEPGDEHCYSLLGKTGGMQPIKLSEECEWLEIAHEMMHALGFVHEQSRTDRDTYVEILWDNIEEKYRPQFAVVPDSFMEAANRGPFDYHSLMLYPPTIFAAQSGTPTMRSRTDQPIAPSRTGLSPGDMEKLNAAYPSGK
jgi:hypothetical protein